MKDMLRAVLVLPIFWSLVLLSCGGPAIAAECNGNEAMFSEGISYECEDLMAEKVALHEDKCVDVMFSEGIDYGCREQSGKVYTKPAGIRFGDMHSEGITFAEIEYKAGLSNAVQSANELGRPLAVLSK